MDYQRDINRRIVESVESNILKRLIRSHEGLIKELAKRDRLFWSVGELHREFKERYGSTENALYHRKILREKGLISLNESGYTLTPFAHSLLSLPNLGKLVGQRGFEPLDLMILLELLDAETGSKKSGLEPKEISTRLCVSSGSVYKCGTSLKKSGLLESWPAVELPKASQTMYKLTDKGKEVCGDTICGAIATQIILDCAPPRWIPISELMNRRERYPRNVQALIERSFNYLTGKESSASDLCPITINMFPWIEQIAMDYVLEKYLNESVQQKRDSSGFAIERKLIFTGGETVTSLVEQEGAQVILFALEGLNTDQAKPILSRTVLVGGMEGSMAYCVVGIGEKYGRAVYESETITSKQLVKRMARECGIGKSRMDPIADGHSTYLKVVDEESRCGGLICHVKTPWLSVWKTQFRNVSVLKRIPIVLGVFVSADDKIGISSGVELARLLRESSKKLSDPQIYAEAVIDYVHKLPKIDRAFNQVQLVSKLQKCGGTTHAEFD